jgi:L-alanine-DL-glutamate epimerase-like enolase superfamily enzyme
MSRTKGARSSRLPLLTDEIGPAGKNGAATTTQATESELTRRILADVIRRIEPTLEERIHTAMVPALRRVGQALLIQLRAELTAGLHDVIARAVAEELSRHPKR